MKRKRTRTTKGTRKQKAQQNKMKRAGTAWRKKSAAARKKLKYSSFVKRFLKK